MPYSDNLRPASFRGVPFHVDASDIEAGRRTQLHEYPQRDEPWSEDLGRATRDTAVTAFVVGADYVEQANAFLDAVEQPGPGTLVHPWLGSMQVTVEGKARVSFDSALGVARISVQFVEAGQLEYPSASDSTEAQSRIAAQDMEEGAQSSFTDQYLVAGQPDFVALSAGADLEGAFASFLDSTGLSGFDILGYASQAASVLLAVRAQMGDPATMAGSIMAFLGLSRLTSSPQRWSDVVRTATQLAQSSALDTAVAGNYTTPARQVASRNTQALQSLFRQGLLAQAVGASSLVGSKLDSTTNAAYDDLVAVRVDLAAALDAEALRPTTTDVVYTALVAARSRVWKDLTVRARDSARLVTITPPATAPALVLAYDLYADAARDAELVGRNRLRHPGFVPPQALKVLTR